MNDYHASKKARYVAAIFYFFVLGFILTGTYFSEQQKAEAKAQTEKLANE